MATAGSVVVLGPLSAQEASSSNLDR
jgi:hypothetical protein